MQKVRQQTKQTSCELIDDTDHSLSVHEHCKINCTEKVVRIPNDKIATCENIKQQTLTYEGHLKSVISNISCEFGFSSHFGCRKTKYYRYN